MRTFTSKSGRKCRQIRSVVKAADPVSSGQSTFVWCKQADGEWKLAKKKMKKKAQ